MSDVQTSNSTPQRGTPEYNAAMIARADQGFRSEAEAARQSVALDGTNTAAVAQPQVPQRPEGIPEKFWDAEKGQVRVDDLVKSYTELERLRGQPPKEPEKPVEGPSAEGQSAEQDAAKEAVEAAGLDWDQLTANFEKTGQLSQDERAALNKAGIPDSIIDNYIDMLSASQEFAAFRTAEYAGGKDVLDAIITRAGKELSPEEIASYNAMLASPNWRVAIDALKARFGANAASSYDANDLFAGVPQSSQGTTAIAFASQREMVEAMNKRDERGRRLYDIDPAYRETVRRRIAVSR